MSRDTRIFHKECASLSKAGFDVHLIVWGQESKNVNGVEIINAGQKSGGRFDRFIQGAKDVYETALSINASIYHFHDPELLFVANKLRKKGKKVIYDVHEDVPRQIMSKTWIPILLRKIVSFLFESTENRIAKRFSGIVAATPFIRDRFLKINKNTIDINNYPNLEDIDCQKDWSKKNNLPLYIGSISVVRGINELLTAASISNIKVKVAGPIHSDNLRSQLEANENWDKIDYLGLLPRTSINELLGESIAGLVTLHPIVNYLDALPVKMFEYMAAGIPVITSNIPLWKEIVEDAACGVAVDPMNPKSIADAMTYYTDNLEEAKKQGLNGRRAVEEKYNWGVEEKKLVSFYKQLIK